MSKKRIAVIGVGSAGILSLSELLPYLTNNWEITSVYDPQIPTLGIGESTNPNFLQSLEISTGFTFADLPKIDGTYKYGTLYSRWRDHDWVNPVFGAGYAVHFNTFNLKEFGLSKFHEMWPKKFREMHGKVTRLIPGKDNAQIEINGRKESFDYIIDCRGFPDNYNDYVMSDCSPITDAVIYSTDPEIALHTYTDHIAMEHGWMFGVPLTTRKTYGYLYNNKIATKEQVIDDLGKYFDVDLINQNLVSYKFKPYYAKKVYHKRILKNGNRALFYEPISASSIFSYVQIMVEFRTFLIDNDENFLNQKFIWMAKNLEDMISYIYHGGSTLDTEFWQHAKKLGKRRIAISKALPEVIKQYHDMDKLGVPSQGQPWIFNPLNLRFMDKMMGYNYFNYKGEDS